MSDTSKNTTNSIQENNTKNSGNAYIGLGCGIGAFGIGSAIVTGATCPLCFLVAPALFAMGVYEKKKSTITASSEKDTPS